MLASTSGYLLFILATKFPGDSCTWCLASATLSGAVFGSALRGFSARSAAPQLRSRLCVAATKPLGRHTNTLRSAGARGLHAVLALGLALAGAHVGLLTGCHASECSVEHCCAVKI